jgi:hypothetical protein
MARPSGKLRQIWWEQSIFFPPKAFSKFSTKISHEEKKSAAALYKKKVFSAYLFTH